MITKETADALAQALLDQEQRQLADRKNARARRVSFIYRFPELKEFQPWQRDLIVRRCTELVLREPLTIVLFFVWLVVVVASIAFDLPSRLFGIGHNLVIPVLALVIVLFQRGRVRSNVLAFLRFVKNSREAKA